MKKKNILIASGIALLSLTITGCSYILDFIDNNTNIDDSAFDVDKVDVNGKTIIQQTYKDVSNKSVYNIDYCPTTGNIKLLIIPVWLYDSSEYIASSKKESVRQNIEKAYLGSNSDTGWRSVKTYYEELSNNSITITGTVTDWYSTSYTKSQVGRSDDITKELVSASTDWYFSNNPSDSRKNYDSDNNGYLDAVMLIYGAPDYDALGDDNLSNLWAYCFWLQEDNPTSVPQPNAFFWASYDFMYSKGSFLKPTPAGSEYGSGDTSHCNIDTHTYIHEMGHIFGLEDYYDYGSNNYSPAGGFSMQDRNAGCHDPYSVMALGWANPYIVTENSEVKIGTFQKTRDLIVVTEKWNGIGSPFDEYLILELYSPTGLNELDSNYTYGGVTRGPRKVGIRLWHIDARLAYSNSYKTITEHGVKKNVLEFFPSQLTSDAKDRERKATYGVTHAFTNTYDNEDYGSVLGPSYYDYNILQLIRKTSRFSTSDLKNQIDESDLFTSGTYQLSDYKDQFVNSRTFKMNNGTFANWKIKVEISGSGNDSTAKISIVK